MRYVYSADPEQYVRIGSACHYVLELEITNPERLREDNLRLAVFKYKLSGEEEALVRSKLPSR